MISYLLSGWRVFVPDANGRPLYRGRVYFYDASTSQPSTVYADKGLVTALGTYVDVDNHGFLPAVWLESDHLYKVVVKQKIQTDPETWQTLWEIDDVGNPFLTSEEITGKSTIAVNTISDLQALDPTDSGRPDYVYVMGWFTPGDTGSPMLFRWVPNASGNDGHWIEPNTTGIGAWEQLFDGEIDPRKFGAVPDSGNACDTSIYNCMMYACEPHTYDSSDPVSHTPRTVNFVASGTYKLNAAFDFTAYTTISQYGSRPVPVVIGENVYFDSQVTVGQDATIESSQVVAAPLVVKPDSMAYVRPQWFSGNVISGIYAAISGGNNCKVYQVADNLDRNFVLGIVIGSDDDTHWVEFCDDSFLIDTDTATALGYMTFKCIVKADKFKSLIKKPTRSVSTSGERTSFKGINPIRMVHKYQTVSDYWFGIGLLTHSDPLDDYKYLLLSWCANSGALNYDLVGGYEVNGDVAFVSVYDSDFLYSKNPKVRIERPFTIKGATISNFIIENVGEKIFHDGGSGHVSVFNKEILVDWFGSLDSAQKMVVNAVDKTARSYNGANQTISGDVIFGELYGMTFLLSGATTIKSDVVTGCTFSLNEYMVTFGNQVQRMKVVGNRFLNGNVTVNDIRKPVLFDGNVFVLGAGRQLIFADVSVNQVATDRSITVVNNEFTSGYMQLGAAGQNWEKADYRSLRRIEVSNNRGCTLSTVGSSLVRKLTGTPLYGYTKSGDTWTSAFTCMKFNATLDYEWSLHSVVQIASYINSGYIPQNAIIRDNNNTLVIVTALGANLTSLQSDVANDGTFLMSRQADLTPFTNDDIALSGNHSSQQIRVSTGSTTFNYATVTFLLTYLPSIGGCKL